MGKIFSLPSIKFEVKYKTKGKFNYLHLSILKILLYQNHIFSYFALYFF